MTRDASIDATVQGGCEQGPSSMTIEELEAAGDASRLLDFSRHPHEIPELSLCEIFYPFGFPLELRTNSPEVLYQAGDLWSLFENRFETKPIRLDVNVVEGDSLLSPQVPVWRVALPLLINVADSSNYGISNLDQGTTHVTLARSTLRHRAYLKHFLLGPAPLCHMATAFTTPIHAACVARNGKGVLLCGDPGAGKTTLAYACARAGWTYLTDDSSFLIRDGSDRLVTGNCHQVRFRPSAATLFPEVARLPNASHAPGKPSIEMSTNSLLFMNRAQTAQVEFLVFLNRRVHGTPELVPYRKDVARNYVRQGFFGSLESIAAQNAGLERLLTADVLELRYQDLDWAVQRLETLVQEGR
jgi:hypothetical protein